VLFRYQPVVIALIGCGVAQRIGDHRALGFQVADQFVVIDAFVALGTGATGLRPLAHILKVEDISC
jgi:hypothetical protein